MENRVYFPSMENIREALEQFEGKSVLVIGDIMLDKYTYGNVSRISPEAPVPVFVKMNETFIPGGAGNVACNLVSLEAKVSLCGVLGQDENAEVLLQILKEKKINTKLVIHDKKRPTTIKHRFVAGNNQLIRVDEEDTDSLYTKDESKLLFLLKASIKSFDCIILSDYAKGLFSLSFTKEVIKIAKSRKILIVADIKPKNKEFFKGVDLVTPNLKEAKEITGLQDIKEIGAALIEYFKSNIMITRGEEGISIFAKEGTSKDFPTQKIRVFDVSGAGDTVIAVTALGLASGLNLEDTAFLANHAGCLVVQKPGTATISLDELKSVVYTGRHLDQVDIVPKLWGYEKWLENNEKYCSKIMGLNKGYQCSLHYHKIKDETFLVTKGHIRMEVGEEILHMREGHFVRITPGTLHRFRGLEDSEFLEISTHHEEEDSYRIEESRKVDPD